MNTRLRSLLVPIVLLSASPLHAQEAEPSAADWFSGNVAIATDYNLRGLSQTRVKPALQGGLDMVHPSGIYLGTWGSNVNFGEAALPRAQVELDAYGGFATSLFDVATIDLGAIYYAYPGAGEDREYDYVEFTLGLSRALGPVAVGLSAKYSSEFFAATGEALYASASLDVPMSFLTISGTVGNQTIEDNDLFGTPDYLDWGIGASTGWGGMTFGAQVVGTDLEEEECFGGTTYCSTRGVFMVSRAL
jgi:uncharacterized protein (TIGR02001 family)